MSGIHLDQYFQMSLCFPLSNKGRTHLAVDKRVVEVCHSPPTGDRRHVIVAKQQYEQ